MMIQTTRSWLPAVALTLCMLAMLVPVESTQGRDSAVEYRRDILPILSDRCFQCHGPDSSSREADLRLDDRENAVNERGVIVPGEPDLSELVRRIESTDDLEVMPPPDAHKQPITDEERQLLTRWIRQGARYQPHWAFVPPERPPVPVVSDESWVRGPIDRFVLDRLESEGLSPSAEADRQTLIRRVYFDLVGLPPSADEVAAFVSDRDPTAYEQLVDRLLSSPHFGERMALLWLDAARYADTNGYSIDGGRHMWLWRDWVIEAFNRNMPYDQFLVEQLAGDLLPNATTSQLIATGFQRNAMVTQEAGTIDEENLVNYNADRVKTLGEAILGLTLGCAQCHDHKYDPISQRDYYRLFAYFNSLDEGGTGGDGGYNAPPSVQVRTVLPTNELPELDAQIESLQQQIAHPSAADVANWEAAERRELERRGSELELHATQLLNISTPNSGEGFAIEDGRFVEISQPRESIAYAISIRLPEVDRPVTGLRLVFYPRDDDKQRALGFGKLQPGKSPSTSSAIRGTFVLTSFTVSADRVPSDQVNLNRILDLGRATASSWLEEYTPRHALDTSPSGWSPGSECDQAHLTVTFREPIEVQQTPYLSAQVLFGAGSELVAARFAIFAVTGTDDGSELPTDLIEIVERPAEKRSEAERRRLRQYYCAHSEATGPLRIALANLEERRSVLTREFPTMVMREAKVPRDTYILTRGDYAQPAERVEPGTLAALPPPSTDAPTNRLGLARWIVMRDHPLTARVAVNHLWQICFGTGIVRTPVDFGAQGEFPTHPELLDWLAVEFMESGWDVKAMLRLIVMSATYRQSSAPDAELLERDPTNRLLARGPRYRLPGEFIRDSALKVSGLLVDRSGGPSVNPYMPGDLWREISHYGSTAATAQTFVQDHGEKLYRRSLYTYWKRTVPPPSLVAFDAPSREVCVVTRPTTNTPLQALVMLNDVQFTEAARAFAEQIIKHSDDDDTRVQWAVLHCLSRRPTSKETKILRHLLDRERMRYTDDPTAANAYLQNGESPRDTSIPPVEQAAWAQIATVLLNLSEAVTRN